jgi:uncharacterized protein YjlB
VTRGPGFRGGACDAFRRAEVEHELILGAGRRLRIRSGDKLELPRGVGQTEDHAAEAVVVLERAEHRQADHLAVERSRGAEVARRP